MKKYQGKKVIGIYNPPMDSMNKLPSIQKYKIGMCVEFTYVRLQLEDDNHEVWTLLNNEIGFCSESSVKIIKECE